MSDLSKTRKVTLANGYELELSYSEAFYDKVRKYFGLQALDVPTDEQLKDFLTAFMAAAR